MEIIPVWKKMTPELRDELIAFWRSNQAVDIERANLRAEQAVCIARDGQGAICAVGTAFIQVLPRLQQPMYYYRQFLAEAERGQKQAVPFYQEVRRVLEAYNAALPAPESVGMLVELESSLLDKHWRQGYVKSADLTFIGYSPRGLQLRVSYFEGVTLFPPVARAAQAAARPAEGITIAAPENEQPRRVAAQKDQA